MHNLDQMIEKYRQELVEFSKQSPVHIEDEYEDFVPTMASPADNENTENDEVRDIIVVRPYKDSEDFKSRNTSSGTLRVQVFAAGQSFPIADATVKVTVPFLTGISELFSGKTDNDGIADDIVLPAPNKNLSLNEDNTTEPFALYNITVSHPDYAESAFTNVPIFDSIKSIQPVELVPLTFKGNEPSTNDFGGGR